MSSGCLPLGTHNHAWSIGSDNYGSILTVYNDEGEEFTLKLFIDDKDCSSNKEEKYKISSFSQPSASYNKDE